MITIDKSQLDTVSGGASYCSTLASITQNNVIVGGAMDGAMYGFDAGGCADAGYGYVLMGSGDNMRIIMFRLE